MTSPNTKRRQNQNTDNPRNAAAKDKPAVKRCTMQTKIIRDIFDFLHGATRDDHFVYSKGSKDDHFVYSKGSKQTKISVLLSLFQPDVITRLKSTDVRVDDPNFIDGNVITADFLLHIDFDKLLQQAEKLNDGLYPTLSTVSLLRPVSGTDVMCLTLVFKRNSVCHMFSRIGDIFGRMVGIDNKIYDIKNWSWDVTAVLCGATEGEDGKNSLFALKFDDAMMRMNEKKLTDPYGTAAQLFFRTGITMERTLYDTVNRRLNRTFERNGELAPKNNHEVVESVRNKTTAEGCTIGDPDSVVCHVCTGVKSVFYKMKNAFIEWLEK